MFEDVICLSHLRWAFVFQRPNHLMSRCAKARRVFFVEEPMFDADTTGPRLDIEHIQDGLRVVVPRLPSCMSLERAEHEQRLLLDQLVERDHVRSPLLWFYTPMAIAHAPRPRARGIVYDCMDELSQFHGASRLLRGRERELFREADVVFTGGHSLFEAKRAHHPRVYAFPSSVDAEHFAKGRLSSIPEPADQASIPRPRVGFFGVIDERMDLELLGALAKLRPSYHFVLIGPVVKIDPVTLPRLPNLHFLGQKRYEDLPSYIAGWNVAIMPFARNAATRFISPTKTLEYLAAGRPVVSTSIRDVVRPYGEQGLVRIADDPRDFAAAVDAAMAEHHMESNTRRSACDSVLARTSWDNTWSRMNLLIDDVLRQKRHDPGHDASPLR